jgi:hypothetical protein
LATSEGSASWPEKSISATPLSAVSAKPIASPATARPLAGSTRKGFAAANRCVSRARRKIANIATAMPAASSIDQPKSAKPGVSKGGNSSAGMEMSEVLRPVHDPMPIQTSEPIPEASRPGTSISGSRYPPIPEASIRSTAATNRRAEEEGERGEGRRHSQDFAHLGRGAPQPLRDEETEPAADRDQGSLGSEHHPEADRGEAGGDHARKFGRLYRRRIEPLGGNMAAAAGEADDRRRGEGARQSQNRE